MHSQPTLPPAGRDFEVYRLVRLEEKSTRDAARELGISQTRVCQILGRVEAFLVATTPGTDETLRARRLEVALMIAAERIDRLYARAWEKFESTEGEHTVTRETRLPGRPPKVCVSTRQNGGECKYLIAALQLSAARAKLPAMSYDAMVPYSDDESAADDESADETCSAPVVARDVTAAAEPIQLPISPSGQESWVLPSPAAVRPQAVRGGPVQTVPTPDKTLSPRDQAARQAFFTRAS